MSVDATKKPDNGIDVEALNNFVDQVRREPSAGMASFGVVTKWETRLSIAREEDEFGFRAKPDPIFGP